MHFTALIYVDLTLFILLDAAVRNAFGIEIRKTELNVNASCQSTENLCFIYITQ